MTGFWHPTARYLERALAESAAGVDRREVLVEPGVAESHAALRPRCSRLMPLMPPAAARRQPLAFPLMISMSWWSSDQSAPTNNTALLPFLLRHPSWQQRGDPGDLMVK